MICNFAEWRGTLPAGNYSAQVTTKIGVVHHVIVGSLASADGEFHSPGAQLSAHFGVGDGTDGWPDGHLVQWVDTSQVAYAQGAGNWPPISYISIETAGQPTTPWTQAQLQTLAQIDGWLAAQHQFPLQLVDHGQAGLTTHCHYPSGQPDPAYGNHSCPGMVRLGQMPQLLSMITNTSGGDVPQPTDFIKHLVVPDGYWHLQANGTIDRSAGSAWRPHAMLANTGEVYAFPFVQGGVTYQDYNSLPAALKQGSRYFSDLWLT